MSGSCSKCLYDDQHPFGLSLTDSVCSGCITHDEKNTLDWARREDRLKELLAHKTGKADTSYYNCVIPVQGDAEDYYVVSKALEYGMRPLIVCVNDYFKNDIGWHNLHNLITHFDLDSYVYNPDITTYKELIRTSLRKLNHMLWPSLALHIAFPMHIATERNIPLIIWGQNQAVEQVGKFSHLDETEMTKWSRIEHDLCGTNVEDLIGTGAQVNTDHLKFYQYPSISRIHKQKCSGIYLSNFLRWDPLAQNSQMSQYGFTPQTNTSTFDPYERAGSSVYYQIHDLLKLARTGYRKVRDHLTREIRHGRVDKREAEVLEDFYTRSKVDIDPFFDWLGVTESGKKWFVDYRLANVKSHIGSPEPASAINLPPTLDKMVHTGSLPKEEFILFGKGIRL